jgi:hypothetical protein
MRYLLNSRDAAALEQLEHDDSNAYLDALTAQAGQVKAGSSTPLPQPGETKPDDSPPDPAGSGSPSPTSNEDNSHG